MLRNRSEYSPVKQAVQPFVECKKQGFQDFTQVAIYGMKFDYHGIIIFIMGLYTNHKQMNGASFCPCPLVDPASCRVLFLFELQSGEKKGSVEIQGKHLTVIEFWDALKLGAQHGSTRKSINKLHGLSMFPSSTNGWDQVGFNHHTNEQVRWGWVKTLVPSEPQNSW